jgi:leucyl/phenylalanyl-tRNA--protein transferase
MWCGYAPRLREAVNREPGSLRSCRRAYLEFSPFWATRTAFEAWRNARLVGGLYGVDAGGAFGGESMFHLESNASKLALLHLVDHLRGRGLDWMDIQMMTPHLESLGATAIPRPEFLALLAATRQRGIVLFER